MTKPLSGRNGASEHSKRRTTMTKKNDTKKPLQSFKAFGIEASVYN
jgi:hypothetical protein